MGELVWSALALVLVFEGLLPLLAPQAWRRMFQQVLALNDGQLRFLGLCSVGVGLFGFWLLS